MTVATQKARIRDILLSDSSISSVKFASLRQSSARPTFVVLTGNGQHEMLGDGLKMTTREYRILGLIQPFEHGREGEGEEAVEPFFATIEGLFDHRPGLWLTDNNDTLDTVEDSFLTDDSGYQPIQLAGTIWDACEWTLRVISIHNITQGA